jgi:hypothetical protein
MIRLFTTVISNFNRFFQKLEIEHTSVLVEDDAVRPIFLARTWKC